MDQVLMRLASFDHSGIKIEAPSESNESIQYFIRLRTLLASGSESKIPPAPFQKALADITVSFDPATKDAGGFTLLITAARQLLPLFPAQKQNMIIALQRIVDLTIAAGVPLPMQPDNEDIDPPFLPPQASSSTSANSKIFVNRPPISNSPPTSPVLASKNIDTDGQHVESVGPPKRKRKLETVPRKVRKRAPGRPLLTWLELVEEGIYSTPNHTSTTSAISDYIQLRYSYYSDRDYKTVYNAVSQALHKSKSCVRSSKHLHYWEIIRNTPSEASEEKVEEEIDELEEDEEELSELEEDHGKGDEVDEGSSEEDDIIMVDQAQPSTSQQTHLRPRKTWFQLVTQALLSSPTHTMARTEIYQFIALKYPFFSNVEEACYARISNILSQKQTFRKTAFLPKSSGQKGARGSYWTLIEGKKVGKKGGKKAGKK